MENKNKKKAVETTKVIYRMVSGEVIALFPEVAFDHRGDLCMSYMHVGQHGAATVDPMGRPATPEEHEPLHQELLSLGYDLEVRSKITHRMNIKRKNYEH